MRKQKTPNQTQRIPDTFMPDCPEGEFKCKSGGSFGPTRCILDRFRCDGDNDCGDWSDEEACPTKITCPAGEFRCKDGTCIPGNMAALVYSFAPYLLINHNMKRLFLAGRWRCDQENDCDSGEDEKNCSYAAEKTHTHTCNEDEFQCKDGRCILVC